MQPVVCRQFTAGSGHAADHISHGRGNLRLAETELPQLFLESELAKDRESGVLNTDGPWPDQLQRAHIDVLEAFRRFRSVIGNAVPRPAGDELCRVALRVGLQGFCQANNKQ